MVANKLQKTQQSANRAQIRLDQFFTLYMSSHMPKRGFKGNTDHMQHRNKANSWLLSLKYAYCSVALYMHSQFSGCSNSVPSHLSYWLLTNASKTRRGWHRNKSRTYGIPKGPLMWNNWYRWNRILGLSIFHYVKLGKWPLSVKGRCRDRLFPHHIEYALVWLISHLCWLYHLLFWVQMDH